MMMKLFRILSVVMGLVLLPAVALAGPLDDAKAAGMVGERVDGYLGVVRATASTEIRVLVDRINQKRRTKYAEVAAEREVSIEVVAAIAGQKLVERAEPGEFVAGADGQWQQK
jgi:uncharacterized protein YdbL (DUF1318 family)